MIRIKFENMHRVVEMQMKKESTLVQSVRKRRVEKHKVVESHTLDIQHTSRQKSLGPPYVHKVLSTNQTNECRLKPDANERYSP
jgi:hypothetical protein